MMSKKQGPLRKFWSSLAGKKGGDDIEESLTRWGVDISKTNTLENRLGEFSDFTEYMNATVENRYETVTRDKEGNVVRHEERSPEDRLVYLSERANGINNRLHKASLPWGTGGDDGIYADASFGWSTIYTKMMLVIHAFQFLIHLDNLPEKQKGIAESQQYLFLKHKINKISLVESAEYLFYDLFITYAFRMSYISWKQRDVVPEKMAMIQTMPQYGGGGPSPYRSNIGFGQAIKDDERK